MERVKDVLKPFDWTFTTRYEGNFVHADDIKVTFLSSFFLSSFSIGFNFSLTLRLKPEVTTEEINMEMLKRPDPIVFYEEIVLYEDELADNGISKLNVRIVQCFLRSWFLEKHRFECPRCLYYLFFAACDARLLFRVAEVLPPR